MRMRVEYHPVAEARLLEIWSYTEENWGEVQADKYLRGLMAAAERLSNPAYPIEPLCRKQGCTLSIACR